MSFTPNLVVGFVLTSMGMVLLLDRLALLEMRTVLQYWPVFLTVFGLSIIVQSLRGDTSTEAGGRGRPIVSPGFVLLLIVIWIVGTNATDERFLRSGAAMDPEVALLGVMGKDDRVSTSVAFRGARMTTVMGRTRLDLRQATLSNEGEVTVDVLGVMGAVEVLVPEGWKVDLRATAIMGGARDRRGVAADDDDDRRGRRERRRAGRDRSDAPATPIASTSEPQPAGTPATPAASPEPPPPTGVSSTGTISSGASSAPPPRLIVKGLIVAGAIIIRS